jgi:predicted metal-dependent phosphoesterase TrpH
MRIDLHVHTADWSDGKDSAADMIRAAIERGLDGMVISDHHRMLRKEEQEALREAFAGFAVFRGAEISIRKDDVNLIGGSGDPIDAPRPHDEEFLREYTRRTGAFSILNHPYYGGNEISVDLDRFRPEAMDVASMNTDTGHRAEYMEVAQARRMVLVAGSDAHKACEVGLFHVKLDNRVETDEGLLRELRAGRLSIGTFDDMLAARKREVTREESLARGVMAAGGTREAYIEQGGTFAFDRVLRNGSFMPPEEFVGMRGDRFVLR